MTPLRPTFAYALSFNGTEVYDGGEITHWTTADYDTVTEEVLTLRLGSATTTTSMKQPPPR
jgi:hypothetical protein